MVIMKLKFCLQKYSIRCWNIQRIFLLLFFHSERIAIYKLWNDILFFVFIDIAFDIDEINDELKQQLDVVAITYGMSVGEFAEQLRKDKEDEQELREAKIAEQEKAAMSVSEMIIQLCLKVFVGFVCKV